MKTYLYVNKIQVIKFKAANNPLSVLLRMFIWRFYSKYNKGIALNGGVYDFSIDYSPITITNMINSHDKFIKNIL